MNKLRQTKPAPAAAVKPKPKPVRTVAATLQVDKPGNGRSVVVSETNEFVGISITVGRVEIVVRPDVVRVLELEPRKELAFYFAPTYRTVVTIPLKEAS